MIDSIWWSFKIFFQGCLPTILDALVRDAKTLGRGVWLPVCAMHVALVRKQILEFKYHYLSLCIGYLISVLSVWIGVERLLAAIFLHPPHPPTCNYHCHRIEITNIGEQERCLHPFACPHWLLTIIDQQEVDQMKLFNHNQNHSHN